MPEGARARAPLHQGGSQGARARVHGAGQGARRQGGQGPVRGRPVMGGGRGDCVGTKKKYVAARLTCPLALRAATREGTPLWLARVSRRGAPQGRCGAAQAQHHARVAGSARQRGTEGQDPGPALAVQRWVARCWPCLGGQRLGARLPCINHQPRQGAVQRLSEAPDALCTRAAWSAVH